MSLQFNFEGKVVLITGSSSGIGAATARLFAKSGACVVVTGRNVDNVSQVAKECREVSNCPTNVLEVVADVTQEEDLKLLLNETIESFGKLDILVNNVGFAITTDITDRYFYEKYTKIMETNLNSIVLLTHLSIKHLEKTKGNIINISSIGGIISAQNYAPLCVSKAGLNMFSKCMAAELGPKGIRVNVISPGVINTNFGIALGLERDSLDETLSSFAMRLPLGRIGEGLDIATTVLFIASDNSSFITGSNLVADGGHIVANVGTD